MEQMKRNRPEFKKLLKKEERRGTTKSVRKIPFPLIEDMCCSILTSHVRVAVL